MRTKIENNFIPKLCIGVQKQICYLRFVVESKTDKAYWKGHIWKRIQASLFSATKSFDDHYQLTTQILFSIL